MKRKWKTSTHSGASGGNCVEVKGGKVVSVRDTKDRRGGKLEFSPQAWGDFIDGVKSDEFNA